MLRRTLILTLTLAAVFAVTGVGGASAKPSFEFFFVLFPIPQLTFTQDPIDMWCKAKQESDGHVEIHCHNSAKFGPIFNSVNPHPPKDEKIFRLPLAVDKLPNFLQHIRLWYAVWPDGSVTADLILGNL
jgi:hypothetical protein